MELATPGQQQRVVELCGVPIWCRAQVGLVDLKKAEMACSKCRTLPPRRKTKVIWIVVSLTTTTKKGIAQENDMPR